MKKRGFVTLLFVLIVGAVAVTVSTSLILLGLGFSQSSFILNQSGQAKALADACAERGLETVRENPSYVGTTNFSLGQGGCSYTVSGADPNKTVSATGTVGTVLRKVQITTNQTRPQINITSWQEIQ
ncbi:MAG: hypothetical protein ACD_11C00108G0013 [uncultured bacterium]|nr:MAG: hypothetical protein ACD_11C00108G0013 [uncultured bacterium]HBR71419.1 hypothetical protein [Candidatus Moranbacteria bacterium]